MPHDSMYPDWPQSDADLVPLPQCDGPKLKAFDFQGPQAIEFLEYLGEGLHSRVFKIRIHGQVYALKLFRFCHDYSWIGAADDSDMNDREHMSAFYDYGEPFSAECRAFGRLKEAGHEELAVDCFGYVLLDEDHERTLYNLFADVDLTGGVDDPGYPELRSRFLGRDGREPPIRGIVKEFGHQTQEEELDTALAKKMLGDVRRLQQLGIFHIDIAIRQMVNDKICDFSTAVTTPHFLSTYTLNPTLTPRQKKAMSLDTFRLSMGDYLQFDSMMKEWHEDHPDLGPIAVHAFPGGRGSPPLRRYELRNKMARDRVFTYVDPRRYNWKKKPKGVRRLRAKPPLWLAHCGDDSVLAANLRGLYAGEARLDWDYKDGLIFPRIS